MIDCREAVSRMWTYLSHDLETGGTKELEEHLDTCQRCCGELEFSRELRSTVASAGTQPIPPQVRDRVDNLLREAETRGGV